MFGDTVEKKKEPQTERCLLAVQKNDFVVVQAVVGPEANQKGRKYICVPHFYILSGSGVRFCLSDKFCKREGMKQPTPSHPPFRLLSFASLQGCHNVGNRYSSWPPTNLAGFVNSTK